MNIEFLNPYWFLWIVFVPLIVYWFYKQKKQNSLNFKFLDDILKVYKFWKIRFLAKLAILASLLSLFVVILANPNKPNVEKNISKNWIDIVFALDISASMNAQDLQPTRLEAAKKIIWQFLDKLKNDRVWLVIFAWKPFTSLPLTFDYNIVKQTIQNLTTNTINQNAPWMDWTNIWDAILLATNLFKNTAKNRQKVIILLTDGDANRWIKPTLAAEFAKKKWIKIYTIWVGSPQWGYIDYKIWPFIQKIRIPPLNTTTLKQIAQITNWKFFRATNNNTLAEIFRQLEKLTKTKITVKQQITYQPLYLEFARAIFILLSLFVILEIKTI